MTLKQIFAVLAVTLLGNGAAFAQVAVTGKTDAAGQTAMLKSADPKLAANKKLVFDFWREVLEGRHMDLAPKYMAESFIEHNPAVPTGRKAFMDFFGSKPPLAIQPAIRKSVVSITADGDLVILAFAEEHDNPKDKAKKYTTTWFDMFRIADGKLVEHWDPELLH
jgi:predicted SnoaL-like aldol condensation-catalyzing enzyme